MLTNFLTLWFETRVETPSILQWLLLLVSGRVSHLTLLGRMLPSSTRLSKMFFCPSTGTRVVVKIHRILSSSTTSGCWTLAFVSQNQWNSWMFGQSTHSMQPFGSELRMIHWTYKISTFVGNTGFLHIRQNHGSNCWAMVSAESKQLENNLSRWSSILIF